MDGDEFSARIMTHDAEYNLEVPLDLHHTTTHFYCHVVAHIQCIYLYIYVLCVAVVLKLILRMHP